MNQGRHQGQASPEEPHVFDQTNGVPGTRAAVEPVGVETERVRRRRESSEQAMGIVWAGRT